MKTAGTRGGEQGKEQEIAMEEFSSEFMRKPWAVAICMGVAMVLFFGASGCVAQNDLVRLIPPDAPVVAGMHRMAAGRSRDALWLATRNNLNDLSRLVTLSNNDPQRRLDQVVVADWAAGTNRVGEHLVIGKGRFDLGAMSSTMAHPRRQSYAAAPVLVIGGNAGSAADVRWLAVPRGDIVLFGTPSAVQLALDRFRSGAAIDARMLERLTRANAHDAAWSSIVLTPPKSPLEAGLNASGADLWPCLDAMREVGLGIDVGKNITIDLHTEFRDNFGGMAMECLHNSLFKNYTPQMRIDVGGGMHSSMRLTLPGAEYDTWLRALRKSQMSPTMEAFTGGAESLLERGPEDFKPVR